MVKIFRIFLTVPKVESPTVGHALITLITNLVTPLIMSAPGLARHLAASLSRRNPTLSRPSSAFLDIAAVWLENTIVLLVLVVLFERTRTSQSFRVRMLCGVLFALLTLAAAATAVKEMASHSPIRELSDLILTGVCAVGIIGGYVASLLITFVVAPSFSIRLFVRSPFFTSESNKLSHAGLSCAVAAILVTPCALLVGDHGAWAPLTNAALRSLGGAVTTPSAKMFSDLVAPPLQLLNKSPSARQSFYSVSPPSLSGHRTSSAEHNSSSIYSVSCEYQVMRGRLSLKQIAARQNETRRPPNVIVVVHESLGYSPLFSTAGKKNTPFLHEAFFQRDDVFPFVHTGINAGSSEAATAPLMTGLVPLTPCGGKMQRNFSIADDMTHRGYTTALFSVHQTYMPKRNYHNYNNLLRTGFDKIVEPKTLNATIGVTDSGMDDLLMTPHIFNYIRNSQNSTNSRPFYLHVILNHLHMPPHVLPEDRNVSGKENLYLLSLKIMDQFYRNLTRVLNETGLAENTILAMAGDHGETAVYTRLFQPHAVHIATFMSFYVPEGLWRSPKDKATLRINTQRRVTTLDFLPTLRSILVAMPSNETLFSQDERDHNLVGRSLIMEEMPVNRQVHTWYGPPIVGQVSYALVYNGTYNVFAVHTSRPYNTRETLMTFNRDVPFRSVKQTYARDLSATQIARWSPIVLDAHPRLLDHIGFVMANRSLWRVPPRPPPLKSTATPRLSTNPFTTVSTMFAKLNNSLASFRNASSSSNTSKLNQIK